MTEFSWSRVWRATQEAVGLAHGLGVIVRRTIYWLILLGVAPLADWLIPEHWISLGGYAVGICMASVGAAFGLSVQAIYTKQTELDRQHDEARSARRQQRRRVMEAMLGIVLAADRIRIAQQVPTYPGSQAKDPGPLTEARQDLRDAVDAYAGTAGHVHPAEALVHAGLVSQLRAAVDHDKSLLALGPPLKRLTTVYKRLALQDEKLDKDEAAMLLEALQLIRPAEEKTPPSTNPVSGEATL